MTRHKERLHAACRACSPGGYERDARHGDDYGDGDGVGGDTLTACERHDLPPSDFVFPEEEAYPIQDPGHARAALSRVSQHGTHSQKKAVRAALHVLIEHIITPASEDPDRTVSGRLGRV
jgi:hypothetical protein